MISLYLFNKLYESNYAKPLLIFCVVPIIIGVFGLIVNINRTTLIVYNFTYSITIYILEVMFKIKADNIVNKCSLEKWIVEYHTFVEGSMDIGRIIGFLLLLVVGLLNNVVYFKILLLIITISIPIYANIMYEVEKE